MSDEETRSRAASEGPVDLVLVDGETVRRVAVPAKGAISFGRAATCDLVFEHPSVSRTHARIHAAAGAIEVEDLASRNGTRVRGVPIAPNVRVRLARGDVIECGDALLFLRAQVASAPAGTAAPARRLVVGAEGRWFELDGEATQLGRRGALRLLLAHLTDARLRTAGRGVPLHEMFEAGWPGERIQHESAAARVYTAVQRLRGLGLASALITRDDGYLLDPALDVRWG
jgi:hypothetical protein